MNSIENNPIFSLMGRVLTFLFGLKNPGFRQAVARLKWSREKMQAYELGKLQEMVTYAYEHSQMYKKLYDDAGVKPADLKTLRDIEKFPVVTKPILKQALADKTIFTQPHPPHGVVAEPTTGSTGNPVTLYLDHQAHQERALNGTRALWMMGAFPTKRFAFLWRKKGISKMQTVRSKLGLFKHIPVVDVQNASGSAVGKEDLSKIVQELIDFKPQVIRGYTSALWIIAQHVKKYNLMLRPECIITSAEYVPRVWQEEMEKIFGCPVHNLYGGTEAAPVALSLAGQTDLTVFQDFYYAEVADDYGHSVHPGTPGRILITDYGNHYMPLIRYEIGDVAEPRGTRQDPFPLWSEVKGRINDVFVLPGGKIVFSHNWHIYLRDLKSVGKFKVVQKALDRIEITLEKASPEISWNTELDILKKTVTDAFGPEINFTWELVDTIPLDPGEKFRPVRSELDQNTILKSVSNAHVEKLKEYPLSSHKAWEFSDKSEVLKLDWNEADMEIPESIKQPLRDFIDHGKLNWYPDVANKELLQELANYAQAQPENIQYFEGSDCGLDYIVRTFMQSGDEAILAAPTYDNFRVYVESVGGIPKFVYSKDLFTPDVDALISAIQPRTKIIYLVNPNNPTGVMYTLEQIEKILKAFPDGMVIVDEAYAEFSGTSAVELISRYSNIIIARSFSKAFGLASLRIGYIITAPENVTHINKIRNGKNVPMLGQIGAIAALRNKKYMEDYVLDVTAARAFLCNELKSLGYAPIETQANFILIKTDDPATFQNELIKQQVFVRGLNHLQGMNGYVRITVPGMREAKKFIERLKQLSV